MVSRSTNRSFIIRLSVQNHESAVPQHAIALSLSNKGFSCPRFISHPSVDFDMTTAKTTHDYYDGSIWTLVMTRGHSIVKPCFALSCRLSLLSLRSTCIHDCNA